MFAIYNNNGLSFRSTIDNLYSLSNVDSIARARNNTEEGLPKDHSIKNKKKLYENKTNVELAKEAYRKVANIDTREPLFHVRDIMTEDVYFLTQKNILQEAYDLMEDKKIKQIPIVNDTTNQIMSLLTKDNILDLIVNDIEFAQSIMKREIDSIYLKDVITTDPITDIRRIAKVLVDFSLTAIPVVDQDDMLKGIVSRANILKAVANTPPFQIWG